MKFTFVLPMYLPVPSGGFKVVYEYANRLQARGHGVTVVHPRNEQTPGGAVQSVKSRLWSYKLRLKHRPLIPWFKLDPGVEVSLIPDLSEDFIPDADAVVATAFSTAFHVDRYTGRKGRKFYLIQGYETWLGSEERVLASWRLPLKKVVVSRWLLERVRKTGVDESVAHISSGLDFRHFKVTTPIGERSAPRVGMLASANPTKGTRDGLLALELAKERWPKLEAVLFGTDRRGDEIPGWVEYVRLPSADRLLEIYNSCQVFLHPSRSEGWGLPACEAMACGCALVVTAYEAAKEFAIDGETALIAPTGQPEALAQRLIDIFSDHSRRLRIAEAGYRHVQRFDWDRAVDSLERLLIGHGEC